MAEITGWSMTEIIERAFDANETYRQQAQAMSKLIKEIGQLDASLKPFVDEAKAQVMREQPPRSGNAETRKAREQEILAENPNCATVARELEGLVVQKQALREELTANFELVKSYRAMIDARTMETHERARSLEAQAALKNSEVELKKDLNAETQLGLLHAKEVAANAETRAADARTLQMHAEHAAIEKQIRLAELEAEARKDDLDVKTRNIRQEMEQALNAILAKHQ